MRVSVHECVGVWRLCVIVCLRLHVFCAIMCLRPEVCLYIRSMCLRVSVWVFALRENVLAHRSVSHAQQGYLQFIQPSRAHKSFFAFACGA